MAFLEPGVSLPKIVEDYTTSLFSFDTKHIHPIDHIYLHKQAWDIIYTSLASSTMTTSKMQESLNNIYSQLKLEKKCSLAKDTIIKGLEDLVLKLGLDPKDVKAI